ncbi:MAG: ribosome silencing factor [Candidatus Omnitrophota bacterium]
MDILEKLKLIKEAALDKKADDIVILDLRHVAVFCDSFVVASGKSSVQVKAIVANIDDSLRKHRVKSHHIEGTNESGWVLMDYGDVLVHIFLDETRKFYGIEKLWEDAVIIDV